MKAFTAFALLIFGMHFCARAQRIVDSSFRHYTRVYQAVYFPSPQDGRFIQRVYYRTAPESVRFEYAGSKYFETRTFAENDYGHVDSIDGVFPDKRVVDWGEAQVLFPPYIKQGAQELSLLKAIYGRTNSVRNARRIDLNGDGRPDLLVLKNGVHTFYYGYGPVPKKAETEEPVLALEVFIDKGDGLLQKEFRLEYPPGRPPVYLMTFPGQHTVSLLGIYVHDAASGAFGFYRDQLKL